MKAIRCIFAAIALSWIASTQCFALWEIEEATKDRLKELGIQATSKTMNAHEIGVWIEFKPSGPLKGFVHLGIRIISEKKEIMSANLLPSEQSESLVTVPFYIDPAYLPQSKITIYVSHGHGGVGYQFNVKDVLKTGEGR